MEVYGSAWGLDAEGVIQDGVTIIDLPGLSQTVTPGATYDGWEAYQVPEGVTQAKLVGTDVDLLFD